MKSLEAKAGKLVVHWQLNAPTPGTKVPQAPSYPDLMILVDRFDGDVVFAPPPAKE
jgi:hypothetical protein